MVTRTLTLEFPTLNLITLMDDPETIDQGQRRQHLSEHHPT